MLFQIMSEIYLLNILDMPRFGYISTTSGCSSTHRWICLKLVYIYIYTWHYLAMLYPNPWGVLLVTGIPTDNNMNCAPHHRGGQCEHHSAEKRLGLQRWGAVTESQRVSRLSASDWGWVGFIRIIQKIRTCETRLGKQTWQDSWLCNWPKQQCRNGCL